MTEAQLRDIIASDISVLGQDLTLLDKEQYIPSSVATRSFIDLYAKDSQGHHVLIELKKSNASAREALHEIHKYVEAVSAARISL
jgi:RecB family endonuclease NucS